VVERRKRGEPDPDEAARPRGAPGVMLS